MRTVKIIGYGLSRDKLGLLAFFEGKDGKINYYHIHSDELTKKEKRIHKFFKKLDKESL